MAIETLSFNFKNRAASQFYDYFANSQGAFNSKLYFASSDGLFVFDEESSFEEVSSWFVLPTTDLGYRGMKTLRSLVFSGKFSGVMAVDVTDEYGTTTRYQTDSMAGCDGFKMALQTSSFSEEQTSRLRSRYFSFKILNVDGAYFSVDSIDVVFIPGPEPRR